MQNQIKETLLHLKKGGLILYPTDTVWGIGCDATNYDAVQKIYKLKKREESKSMICLMTDLIMLKKYIKEIPSAALNIITHAQQPTTIIYDEPKSLAKNLINNDNTIAIRIPNYEFCIQLLQQFNKPIVSTSANMSEQIAPNSFKEISKEILKGVDYVVNLPNEKSSAKPSSIIKVNNKGIITTIRT